MATTISTKRQVVIPKKLMEEFGLHPGEKLDWKSEGGKLTAYPVKRIKTGKIEDLRGMFTTTEKYPAPDFDVATLLSGEQK